MVGSSTESVGGFQTVVGLRPQGLSLCARNKVEMLKNGGGATHGGPTLFPDLVGARVAPQRCPILRPSISSVAFAKDDKKNA